MRTAIFAACLLFAGSAASRTYEDGYREGFRDGFAAGQRQDAAGQSVAPVPAPAPNYGIRIIRAAYGDDERTCRLTRMLARRMNGRNSASLKVTNELCGDPAPGERKLLRVDYTCGGNTKQASAPEHRTLSLRCP